MNRDDSDKSRKREAPTYLSACTLAAILGRTERAIRQRAQRNNWDFKVVTVKGQAQKRYAIAGLTNKEKTKVFLHFGLLQPELAEYASGGETPAQIRDSAQAWDRATEPQRELAKARHDILQTLEDFCTGRKRRRKAVEQFANQYNGRELIGIDPHVYRVVKKVSASRLYEWSSLVRKYGFGRLITDKRSRLGKSTAPPEQLAFILGTIVNGIKVRAKGRDK